LQSPRGATGRSGEPTTLLPVCIFKFTGKLRRPEHDHDARRGWARGRAARWDARDQPGRSRTRSKERQRREMRLAEEESASEMGAVAQDRILPLAVPQCPGP
jgi:hypothetical protein